ncbi:MAG: sulfatase family protein, partial [Planctomycetota bacterium]
MIGSRLRQGFVLVVFFGVVLGGYFSLPGEAVGAEGDRPNLLILMTDNQYYEHLGCYGDPVVKTPHIDRLAKTGVRFTHAFCNSPSCTPARSAYLTGQDIWRLEEGANLWSVLPGKFPVYTDLLVEAGYFVGYEGKGWGPGDELEMRESDPGGEPFKSVEEFIGANTEGKPWSYWFNMKELHRPYTPEGAGVASGMKLDEVFVPPYLPDCREVREDISDYLFEIQTADVKVGAVLSQLEELGELENTVVVFCSDNGWQMPRGLANLYDFGTRVPLVISWPGKIRGGRVADELVYLNDLAPTFLDLADVKIPEEMTAASLRRILLPEGSGVAPPIRDAVVLARERHAYCREGGLGYPGRAIRTRDYLYIRNYEPDRWPAGDPPLFGD